MTEGFSSLANSLEAGISESLDELHVLLLSLAHVLMCVVFRDAGHDALKAMMSKASGGHPPPNLYTGSMFCHPLGI